MSIPNLLFSILVIFLLLTSIGHAHLSDEEKKVLHKEIQDYILTNPEIIIKSLQDYENKISELSKLSEKEVIHKNFDQLFKDQYSYSTGDKSSEVTLVAFLDARCGYCKKFFKELSSLELENAGVRFVIKEFPILGEESLIASKAGVVILNDEGPAKYYAFVNEIMNLNGSLSINKIKNIYQEIGADPTDLETRMEKDFVYNTINSNYGLANALKIQGTPTFVIGTEVIRGYRSKEQLMEIIVKNFSN